MRTSQVKGAAIKMLHGALLLGALASVATVVPWSLRGGARCANRDALILLKPWSERDSAFVHLSPTRAYQVMICKAYFPGYGEYALEALFARFGKQGALEIKRRLPMEREGRAILSALQALALIHRTGTYSVREDSTTLAIARAAALQFDDPWFREPATARLRLIEQR